MSGPRRLARRVIAAAVLLAAAVMLWFTGVTAPAPATVRAAYVPSDAWLLDRHGEVLDSRRIRMDVRRLEWVPLEQVSPAFLEALIRGEDRRFWIHAGVDWRGVGGALHDELVEHRRRGASTITMQLARLLQQRAGVTGWSAWRAKLEQVRLALALERRWSKRQILEAYVNVLGYRGELQGIGAASTYLFGTRPEGLSRPESVVLAALLPNPDGNREQLVRRACARALALNAPLPCAAVTAAADAMLGKATPLASEHLAPQLAQRLLTSPGERRVTTLDAGVQRLAVGIVNHRIEALADHNVRDGAALVVDNDSGEVLAYVGSAGSQSRAREVDGVRSLRQAGSTLKPFLYELALEKRYLTAASLLADAPLSVDTASGVYIPQDYEHDYKGMVSARSALASSLNIPAVRTLMLVGIDDFRDRLRALGYEDIRHEGSYYGYSLALGSAEVSLWQQAGAYSALARGGNYLPLTLSPRTATATPRPVLAADASFVVGDILADAAARAITFGLGSHLQTPFWAAAKTGTSEDMRDNWCIGYSRRYTVAVWVGNFEGDSMQAVSGVSGAAPIWHELMAALQAGHDEGAAAPTPPDRLSTRRVQFVPAVEAGRSEWFLSGTEPGHDAVAAVPTQARPAIRTPADGTIIAIDPDMPPATQRVALAADGATAAMRWHLNGELLGSAGQVRLWKPAVGTYLLTLEDAAGNTVDRVGFRVRESGW